jgi:hypothetical protein
MWYIVLGYKEDEGVCEETDSTNDEPQHRSGTLSKPIKAWVDKRREQIQKPTGL